MVSPEHVRIDYQINPYMDTEHQPDPELSMKQWVTMGEALRASGAQLDVLGQRFDSPDMVYAQNLGLVWQRAGQRYVLMSQMRFPQIDLELSEQFVAGFAHRAP